MKLRNKLPGSLILVLFFKAIDLSAQYGPLPVLPDTGNLGKYSSRTMSLLHFSNKEHPNVVRILVYGQSISEQDWWLEVKRSVKERFPDANIIMENKAIGGFSTEYLCKTVEMDVSAFYPDLVLLHDYGGNADYEKVLSTIRRRTASEVAIMTDHYTGENRWSDTMSAYVLPSLAEKYKCDLINIRDPWKAYLKDNSLDPGKLLKDGIHLNDYGNFLMAELVKPLFVYKPEYSSDIFNLETVYKNGVNFSVSGDTVLIRFKGNRVDVLFNEAFTGQEDTLFIKLDGKKPSSFEGTFYMSRPYNSKGESWPWKLPAAIHVDRSIPWISETWSLVYTKANPPYEKFNFKIIGSVSGKDGHGTSTRDFKSSSGRVIIRNGDVERATVWLPDSTKVMLNSGSKLEYDAGYNVSARNVRLTGEAYFKVATNREKPFVVKVDNIDVIATGTQFNVFSFPNEDRIESTLEEGHISVNASGMIPVNLNSGQQAVYFKEVVKCL